MNRLLIGLMLAITIYAFDDLALATLLPAVATELRGDGLYSAAFLAFLLANLASLVATGYFIDRIGVVRPFAIGMALFFAGLMLGLMAASMPAFVIGRALQGLGGGAIQAVVSAVIVLAWRSSERQRVISWATSAWMVPALVGPLLAGWVAEAHDWRYVFGGLAVFSLFTTAIVLPRLFKVAALAAARHAVANEDGEPPALPLPLTAVTHAITVAIGTGTVLAGLDYGGWLGLAIVVLGGLITRPSLLASLPAGFWTASSPLGAVLLLRALACGIFFGIEAWLPWTITRTGQGSVILAGLVISSSAFGWMAATWWVDSAIARIGARPILFAASALLVIGTSLAWFATTQVPLVSVLFLAWTVSGFAMGLCYPVVATLAMAQAERGREGRLSMMLGLTDTLGITTAIGLGGAILRADDPGAMSRHASLWLGFVLLAALLPLLLIVRRRYFVLAAKQQ